MARHVERLADIKDGEELWKIVVRIHLIWNVVSNNKEHFEMIFVDNRIACVGVQQKMPIRSYLYCIKFKSCEINIFISDVIGMVDNIGYAQTDLVQRNSKVICNNMLNCTLWESYADKIIRFNKDRVDAPVPTNALLQYAKMMEEGKYLLSVTNTYNVTLLCVDADFPLMKDFIEKMSKESRVTLSDQLGSNSQLSSQNSENSQLTPVQKLLSKVVVLPIAEIIQLKDDLEITSEHKPDAVAPAGKRHFPGASSESTTLEGLCDGEISSNKLKKIIKS
ncbi:uncharacterized protein LOC131614380 [Vicia villosa]|uniref:uncharacterized protein LOC131614380 n=1 Tax=Vicia villosa TaxID=3911 RepID=UPI00273B43C5|nr:uncharacterized protein LOC131614380 [Vicia villosa]